MEQVISASVPEKHIGSAEARAPARLSGRWLRLVRAAWVIAAALAVFVFVASLPAAVMAIQQGAYLKSDQGMLSNNPDANPTTLDIAVTMLALAVGLSGALVSLILAVLIFWRRSEERMAVFVSFYLLWNGIVGSGPLELMEFYVPGIAVFTTDVLQISLAHTLGIALLSLFPDGRFAPRWTRWLLPASITVLPLALISYFLHGQILTSPLMVVVAPILIATVLPAFYAQVYRYRHVSSRVERQQTKWVVYGFGLSLLLTAISGVPYLQARNLSPGETLPLWLLLLGALTYFPSLVIMPVALTVSVLRYRLWDIDIVINRTLVYGSLTAGIVTVYVLIVGLLGTLFQSGGNLVISLFATGIVAMSFQPLRERLQRRVNRLMFGERDDPYAVLGRLSQRLEVVVASQSVLPTIVETVAEALKLPYAAIALKEGDSLRTAAEYTRASTPASAPERKATGEMEILPLVYQLETMGQMILAPRAPGEQFSPTDRRLLETIARQAGIAAYNVRLTQDLQRSRERLVTTREEERRRLRRDLHDGLGPVLASMSFKLDAIHNLADRDPTAVQKMAAELKTQVQGALDDIRRIAYDLRPPALDELGLVGALKEHIASGNQVQRLKITLEAPANLPPLTAAVEVAAYRIALEAMTNVARHARAHHCCVRLSLSHDLCLCLEVTDDGCGVPNAVRAGVGLTSMRERAEELGGMCVTEALPEGGTGVLARLPFSSKHVTVSEEYTWNQSES